jgi:hypothetical protein
MDWGSSTPGRPDNGREEEKRLAEEKRQERMKVVEAATAQAKKKKKRLDEQKELKARADAKAYKLFLVKEAEREKMLADEAKEQLAKKSEEADRARMAKAEKDWQELQERESAEGVPLGASVFSYRSRQADLSREAFESVGNLRDRWNEASLEKGHWFDSDLCILEPINSTQMAVFEQQSRQRQSCWRNRWESGHQRQPWSKWQLWSR